ncbi:MAG: DUF2807 domain-containing protein [Cytophagales bacterium]|nr:DUF2807 domain-containing protein [Cytophagales bacterium]
MSPYINVVLQEGPEEKVEITSRRVDENDIHVDVDGNTLRIYLEGSRLTPRNIRENGMSLEAYKHADITAYVTYKTLKKLSVRGDQRVVCESSLKGKRFKLKAYGDNQVLLMGVEADFFKASMYGDNRLEIDGGKSIKQKYLSFGDNEVKARDYEADFTKTTSFGDGEFSFNAKDVIKVVAFGDADIQYHGGAYLERGLILGDSDIRRR